MSVKVFQGLDKTGSQRNRSKNGSSSHQTYNGFSSQPIPPTLKKLTSANQSLEKYMGKVSYTKTNSERALTKSSEKARNNRTITSEDGDGKG